MNNEIQSRYNDAKAMLKANGILGIVLGSIGALIYFFVYLILVFIPFMGDSPYAYAGIYTLFISIIFILLALPQIYFIIFGIIVLRTPRLEPNKVKFHLILLSILGLISNILITVFSIILLVKHKDYVDGYIQETSMNQVNSSEQVHASQQVQTNSLQ